MADVISSLLCLPANGRPMAVMQPPACRWRWRTWSRPCCAAWPSISTVEHGASPMLFVCEEAHRYASADRTTGFLGPLRKAVNASQGRPQIMASILRCDAAPGGA